MSTVRPPLVSVLAATAVTMILMGRSGGPAAAGEGALRAVARAVFVPVESAGAVVFRPWQGAVAGLGRAGDVAEAEAALARERERARSEAARADAVAAENGRLAALLGLDGPMGGDGVAARVVSVGGGRTGAALMLDRGGEAGLRPGMPVVAAGGLVGRILEVARRHSTVLPLTDAGSAVGVRCISPPATPDGAIGPDGVGAAAGPAAVVQGHGGPTLRLDLLDPSAPVRHGDLAVTSGLRHSRFPAGLPVGRLAGAPGRFVVEPFVPPDRLELVKVLRWEPEL